MSADAVRALTRLAPIVRADLGQLARVTADKIADASEAYRDPERLSRDELVGYVERNMEYLLDHEPTGGSEDRDSQPWQTGRDHALRGIPLADVLTAYRIGFAVLWDAITQTMIDNGAVVHREVVDAASEMFWRADHFGQAVTGAHRDAVTEMVLRRDRERSALVEALVTGSVVGRGSLGEVAAALGMPQRGQFLVVVAATVRGGDPLPGISPALREHDVVSAWRLASSEALGVLSLPTPDTTAAVSCLEEHAHGRVGVGPVFGDLDAAPQAYYLAGIAARSRTRDGGQVRQFARTPIAMLVAGAPDVAAGVAADVLGPVLALPEQDRDVLLQTFEVWLDAEGSIPLAGRRLYCHANTVRHRLRKLGELTGRSTDAPEAVADLAVAVQAWRLVGDDDDA